MKKLLSILGALALISTGATSVVACGGNLGPNPPQPGPPTPPVPPKKHDIKYYQDLIKLNQTQESSTAKDIEELNSKDSKKQICGGDYICSDLQEMIDTTQVELYKNEVTINDSHYEILVLQNPSGFDDQVKKQAREFLEPEKDILNSELFLINKYLNNDYYQKDVDQVNNQIAKVNKELEDLSI